MPLKQLIWSPILPMIFLALGAADLVRAEPQAIPTTTTAPAPSSSPTSPCGFMGDNNTYGIGVRLGLYLQWLGSSLAYNFIQEEARSMRGINLVFTLSNFAGLIYITATNGTTAPSNQLYAIEVWIVLTFCLGGVCSGQVGDDEKSEGSSRSSKIGKGIQLVVGTAIVFYSIWFLYVGMDKMQNPPCSRFAFFFAKVDMFHWFRTFLKVVLTMSAVLLALTLILSVVNIYIPPTSSKKRLFTFISLYNNSTGEEYFFSKFLVPLALVFFVVSTELIIKWNHIQGVNTILSTGQILPVVAGGGSLIRTLWKFCLTYTQLTEED